MENENNILENDGLISETQNAEDNQQAEGQGEELNMSDILPEEDKIIKLEKELEIANDKYLRLYSEFDNFKKRNLKERIELLQTANADLMIALLPVLDDFERAEKSMKNITDVNAINEGVQLIYSKLKNILIQKGLKAFESVGSDFNIDLHEAITNITAEAEEQKGKVVDEIERGYQLGEKVIRYAKVIVAQ